MLPIGDDGDLASERDTGAPGSPAIASLTFFCLLLAVFAGQHLRFSGLPLVPGTLTFVPGALFGGADLSTAGPNIPPPATLVTYQFLHGSWPQLLGNLLFLWVFGRRVEQTLGSGKFTVLLLACGVAAALAQAWPDPSSSVATIGASGGIAGILGAYLFLHPRGEIRVRVAMLPAWLVVPGWFGLQLLVTKWTNTAPGGVAFAGQVGGFVCGLLLAPVLHFLALLSADARPVARTLRSRDSSY